MQEVKRSKDLPRQRAGYHQSSFPKLHSQPALHLHRPGRPGWHGQKGWRDVERKPNVPLVSDMTVAAQTIKSDLMLLGEREDAASHLASELAVPREAICTDLETDVKDGCIEGTRVDIVPHCRRDDAGRSSPP
jgi:hypothetical protein